jgi:hypothetical protein
MLSSMMQELSKEWELTNPIPEESPGSYKIPLEDGLSINVSTVQNNELLLTSGIATVPKGKEEMLFEYALLANLFGQGTKESLLGLNDSGNILTLSRFIDYDVNFQEFRNIMEDFINTIDFWREEVLKYQ